MAWRVNDEALRRSEYHDWLENPDTEGALHIELLKPGADGQTLAAIVEAMIFGLNWRHNEQGWLTDLSIQLAAAGYDEASAFVALSGGRVLQKRPLVGTALTYAIASFNANIEAIEARCMAVDGPVTPTLKEMREDELSEIWHSLRTIQGALAGLDIPERQNPLNDPHPNKAGERPE